jgi:rhamnosyltransferase
MYHPDLCAVITTYRPDVGFASRFEQLACSCRMLVVIDNTPGGHRFEGLDARFVVLQDGHNKGLGRALNMGIAHAIELGCRRVVLFDQDSTPETSLIEGLQSLCAPLRVVGPTHLDDQTASSTEASRAHCVVPDALKTMSCLPTSGMLFPIDGWGAMQHFSEELFLDLVDFDWCWRLRQHGWTIYKAEGLCMLHRLGLGQRRLLGLTYHIPAPYRHYFQFRDTLRLALRNHVPLYSKIRLVGILPLKLLAYPFLLDNGLERLRWMLRGIADALRGRGGVGSASAKLGT